MMFHAHLHSSHSKTEYHVLITHNKIIFISYTYLRGILLLLFGSFGIIFFIKKINYLLVSMFTCDS